MGIQADIFEHHLIRVISEADILYNNFTLHIRHGVSIRIIGTLGFRIHHLKNALGTGQCCKNSSHLGSDLADRHVELTRVLGKNCQPARRQPSEYHQDTSDANSYPVCNLGHIPHNRASNPSEKVCLELRLPHVVIQEAKFFRTFIFVVKDLDNLLPGYCFFEITIHSTESRLLSAVVFFGKAAEQCSRSSDKRDRQHNDKRQHTVRRNHKNQGTCKHNGTGYDGEQ